MPVPVDEQGIDVRALQATGARAVVVARAPWPTGVVLAPERRLALIEWATRRDAYVVEDDYDAEFRYDREPVGALQGLAADRVVSIGTVSKSLAPALRIGWLLCPPALTGPDHGDQAAHRPRLPTLDQLALARLVESGRYDRHLRRMRRSLRGPAYGPGHGPRRTRPGGPADGPRGRVPRRRAPARHGRGRRTGRRRRGARTVRRPVRDQRLSLEPGDGAAPTGPGLR